MKKLIAIALLSLFSFLSAKAQDSLQISVGFMFAPQAGLSLKSDAVKGFDAYWLLHEVVFISKGKFTLVQMYTFNSNALAFAMVYQAFPKIGFYGVVSKRLFNNEAYLGAGTSFSIADGRASGFAEFGSSLINNTPTIYTGVFIPMTFKVK